MSARDDLGRLIEEFWDSDCERVAAEILAAGWRPPARRIETSEELEELPELAAVRTRSGLVWQHTRTDEDRLAWCLPGEHFDCPSSLVPLPGWVLWEPGDDDE